MIWYKDIEKKHFSDYKFSDFVYSKFGKEFYKDLDNIEKVFQFCGYRLGFSPVYSRRKFSSSYNGVNISISEISTDKSLSIRFDDCLYMEEENYMLSEEEFYHRENGPAYVRLFNGTKRLEFVQKNRLHRTDGPSYIRSFESGDTITKSFWLFGERYNFDNYLKKLKDFESVGRVEKGSVKTVLKNWV